MNIKLVCKECGEAAANDKEKNNENWSVFKTECEKCGGEMEMKFE